MTSTAPHSPPRPDIQVDHPEGLDSRQVYQQLDSLLGGAAYRRLSNSGRGGNVSIYVRRIPKTEGKPASIELRAGRTDQPNGPTSCWIFRSDGSVTMGQLTLFGQEEMINIGRPPEIHLLTEVLQEFAPSAASTTKATRGAVEGALKS